MEVQFFCILIMVFSGSILLYFYYHNQNRCIERYLLRNDKQYYLALQFAYFILIISLVFNMRFVLYNWMEGLKTKMMSK